MLESEAISFLQLTDGIKRLHTHSCLVDLFQFTSTTLYASQAAELEVQIQPLVEKAEQKQKKQKNLQAFRQSVICLSFYKHYPRRMTWFTFLFSQPDFFFMLICGNCSKQITRV